MFRRILVGGGCGSRRFFLYTSKLGIRIGLVREGVYVYVTYMSLNWWGEVALSLEGGSMSNLTKVVVGVGVVTTDGLLFCMRRQCNFQKRDIVLSGGGGGSFWWWGWLLPPDLYCACIIVGS